MPRLSRVEDVENDVYVSVVSVWEIATQGAPRESFESPQRSKQPWRSSASRHCRSLCATYSPIESLPNHHRDPFDRMLVCQAQIDDLTLVTSDRAMRRYPIAVLPAS